MRAEHPKGPPQAVEANANPPPFLLPGQPQRALFQLGSDLRGMSPRKPKPTELPCEQDSPHGRKKASSERPDRIRRKQEGGSDRQDRRLRSVRQGGAFRKLGLILGSVGGLIHAGGGRMEGIINTMKTRKDLRRCDPKSSVFPALA